MAPTVLVVDDSSMIRMQVCRTLQSVGYETVQAADGQDAWDRLAGGLHPDLIVCDVNMPRMNGLELLEVIQEHRDELPPLTIVMLTTEGQPDTIRAARQLGAKAWLVKPLRPDLLLSAVASLVDKAA